MACDSDGSFLKVPSLVISVENNEIPLYAERVILSN